MADIQHPQELSKLSPSIFFRALDLAFFVPGVVLLVTIFACNHERMPKFAGDLFDAQIYSSRGFVMALASLVAIYLLGLICHAIARAEVILDKIGWLPISKWFAQLWMATKKVGNHNQSSKSKRICSLPFLYDRLAYYWYLTSTCRNSAYALIGSAIIVRCKFGWSNWLLLFMAGAGPLWLLSWEYFLSYEQKIADILSIECPHTKESQSK